MAGETEQKDLPASQRKLRKAREKGQVASSADFVSAMTFAAGLVMLLNSWPRFVEIYTSGWRLALDPGGGGAAGSSVRAVSALVAQLAATLVPLLAVVAAAGFLAHVAHKKGLIISVDPIIPNLSRINPAEGFKKIFSARHGAEFVIALLRCLGWFVVAGLLLWLAFPHLAAAPVCELPCVSATSHELFRRLLAAAVLFIIVLGMLDLPFQTYMFLKEQRMSRTEMKREYKETEGSPEFAGYRRGRHREMIAEGGGGRNGASLIFVSSGEAVAIRYDPVFQPVPIVVAKGHGVHADPIIKAAQLLGTPIEVDPRLAIELARCGIGAPVPEREFSAVAIALVRHGKAG